jgi:hypothetical protein
MPAITNAKSEDRPAEEVVPRNLLTPAGLRLLSSDLGCADYLDLLIEAGLTADGIRLLAAALPPREAIWWGCLCVEVLADPDCQPQEELAALGAMAQWVVKPDAGCTVVPERVESKPAARLARAVAAVKTMPTLVPRHVSTALLGAAARGTATEALVHQRRFLALGIHIWHGKYRWTTDA